MMPPRCARALACALSTAIFLQSSPALASTIQAPLNGSGAAAPIPVVPQLDTLAAPGASELPRLDAVLDSNPVPSELGIQALSAAAPTTASNLGVVQVAQQPLAAAPLTAAGQAPVGAAAPVNAARHDARLEAEERSTKSRPETGVTVRTRETLDQASPPAIEETPEGRALESRLWKQELEPRGFARAGLPETVALEAASVADAPLGAAPTEVPQAGGSAAPASPQTSASEARRTTTGFLASLVAAQLWVEGSMLIVPLLAKSLSDSFMFMSGLAILSFFGLTAGSLAGGPVVDLFGIRKVYIGTMVGRTVVGFALAYLFFTGGLGLPGLMALVGLEFLLLGASRIAEAKLPTALHGSAEIPVNRFGIWKQMVIEGIGIAGPLAAGGLIAAAGFGPVLALLPLIMIAGAALAVALMRVPDRAANASRSSLSLGQLGAAWRALRASGPLKRATLALTLTSILTAFLYFLIGPAFGLFVTGQAQAATGVTALLTGLYAAGGFAATVISAGLDAVAKRRLAALPESRRKAQERRIFLGGARNWSLAAALGFLGLWSLLLGAPLLAYTFMLPLGLVATGVLIPFETMARVEAPEEVRGTVIGLVQAIQQAAIAIGFLGLGWLFDRFSVAQGGLALPTSSAFIGVGLLATAASAAFLYLAARIHRGLNRLRPLSAEEAGPLAPLTRGLEAAGLSTDYHSKRVSRRVDPGRPTVVLMGSGADALLLAWEGADQSPEDVHVVPDPSWLIETAGPGGQKRVFLRKGLYFEPDGTPVIVEYRVPRLVQHLSDLRLSLSAAPLTTAGQAPSTGAAPAGILDRIVSRLRAGAAAVALAASAAAPAKAAAPSPGWEVRVLAARTAWGGATTTGIYGVQLGPDAAPGPIKASDLWAVLQREGFLNGWTGSQALEAQLQALGAQALSELAEAGIQTDSVKLVVRLDNEDGRLVPVVTALRGVDDETVRVLRRLNPRELDSHFQVLLATVLARARQRAAEGRPGLPSSTQPSSRPSWTPPDGKRTFGTEVEMIGLTRQQVAEVVRSVVGGEIEEILDPKDYTVTRIIRLPDGRVWEVEDDDTLGAAEPIRAEIVTPPLTEDEIPILKEIIRRVKDRGAQVNESSGVHVHVGARGAQVWHINRLIDALIEGEPIVVQGLFRTNMERLKRFARLLSPEFIREFRRNRPRNFAELWDLWYGKGYDPKRKQDRWDKSRKRGFNLHSFAFRRTFELRYFDGTLDPDRIEQYIRFALALADQAQIPKPSPKSRGPAWERLEGRAHATDLSLIEAAESDMPEVLAFIHEIRGREHGVTKDESLDPEDINYDLTQFDRVYGGPEARFVLLRDHNGRVLGTAALVQLRPGVAEMRKVYLSPELRGKGMGSALVDYLIEEARIIGYDRMELETLVSMVEAQKLYRKRGFIEHQPDTPHDPKYPPYLEFFMDLSSPKPKT